MPNLLAKNSCEPYWAQENHQQAHVEIVGERPPPQLSMEFPSREDCIIYTLDIILGCSVEHKANVCRNRKLSYITRKDEGNHWLSLVSGTLVTYRLLS